jgi:iron complex transport system substrate-binding protein
MSPNAAARGFFIGRIGMKVSGVGALLFGVLLLAGARGFAQEDAPSTSSAKSAPPARIVSLAPSVTEVLFELGLGDRVVGVTRFCDYPKAAKKLPPVGGFFDPNYEAILALKPDLVILLSSGDEIRQRLERLGIATLTLRHETIPDILKSFETVGGACGVEAKARETVERLRRECEAVVKKTAGRPKTRTLVSVGRDLTAGNLGSVYAAGPGNLYDEIVGMVGGINVLADRKSAYPQVSAEAVLMLKPDVIVELTGELPADGPNPETIARHWRALGDIPAVKNNRVHVLTGNFAVRPGPRYVDIVRKMARLLHPELKWDETADE